MSLRSVRDCSGILSQRSGERYSGKPDGMAGTPKILLLMLKNISTITFISLLKTLFLQKI
jgi:hypothetical protein